jgi:class 3 adenylate cyclase
VRANDRLDFFGTTVNVAARLQGKAESGELVLTRALANEASIARVLSGVRSREYRASLKGIESAQELVAFDLYAATEAVRRPAVAPTDEVPVIM